MAVTKIFFFFVALLFAACVIAEESESPRVLGLNFTKVERTSLMPHLQGRATQEGQMRNQGYIYTTTIGLGTPRRQWITVAIDTGSSHLWIPLNTSLTCIDRHDICKKWGTYKPEASKTNEKYYSFSNSPNASDNYESPISFKCSDTSYDNTVKSGVLMQEVLSLDGERIPRVIFGAGKGSLYDVALDNGKEKILGSWGLGFPQTDDCTIDKSGPNGDLAPASHNRLPQFQSVLSLMKEAQLIHSMTYSLWMRDRDQKVGYILFGGVDQGKFSEPLIGMPVVPLPGRTTIDAWTIQMTSIELHGDTERNHNEKISMETPVVAMLDSGSNACKMPKELAHKIFRYVNPKFNPKDPHGPIVPCEYERSNLLFQGIGIEFGFGGPGGAKILVSIHEFVSVIQKKQKWPKVPMDEVCQLTGIEIWDQDFVRLGDTFLRSAYVVYDTESPGIALAQTRYTVWSRVLEIRNNTIPYLHHIVGVVGASSSTPTATESTVTGTATLSTPTSSQVVTETTVYVTAPLSTPTANSSSNSTLARRALSFRQSRTLS